MGNLLLVGFGGAAGAIARYCVGVQTLRWFGSGWPYGTLAVNVIGGLLMGALVGYLAQRGGADQERLRLLLGVGVLGGFTTFSAYSLEVALMLERRQYGAAGIYALGSTVAAVAALFAGMILVRRLLA
ncbi:fluoride efflux transporter CrcB [Phenylobacterium sp.]|uniref:fluoride efflux transporter CrcB n=1 Tax=Phenylobacterium sp. TaxID=1871053 RepID=UPI002733BB7E|nr:fluoride efflux transporter CrcB [Phenylobacterium sp.]MDP3659026.1 fluoride efflux transporter CrcB [Phenylobacterium sp.]